MAAEGSALCNEERSNCFLKFRRHINFVSTSPSKVLLIWFPLGTARASMDLCYLSSISFVSHATLTTLVLNGDEHPSRKQSPYLNLSVLISLPFTGLFETSVHNILFETSCSLKNSYLWKSGVHYQFHSHQLDHFKTLFEY